MWRPALLINIDEEGSAFRQHGNDNPIVASFHHARYFEATITPSPQEYVARIMLGDDVFRCQNPRYGLSKPPIFDHIRTPQWCLSARLKGRRGGPACGRGVQAVALAAPMVIRSQAWAAVTRAAVGRSARRWPMMLASQGTVPMLP